MKLGINEGISNADYHADREYLSSTSLKQILKDLEQFHRERILGFKQPEKEKPHLLEGSLTHSLILEPEKVQEEYAFFEGFRKQGKEYEQFLLDNPGKTIISKPQKVRCDRYFNGYKRRKEAQAFLKGGFPELTLCSSILDVPVKTRYDYINPEAGYIIDVKTTQYESGADNFKLAMDEFKYDLSAALYCQVASDIYHKLFDFYFMVISKSDFECNIYKASSETLERGHSLVNKAIIKYKKALRTNNWTNATGNARLEIVGDYEIQLV